MTIGELRDLLGYYPSNASVLVIEQYENVEQFWKLREDQVRWDDNKKELLIG